MNKKVHGNKGRKAWNKGRKASEEERQRIKDTHWTKKPYEETLEIRKAMSINGTNAMKRINDEGKAFRMPKGYHTEEHKQFMREFMTGRIVTWNDKIKASHWTNKSYEEVQDIISRLMDKRGPMRNQYEQDWYISSKTKETLFYLSSYERRRMEFLDNDANVLYFTNRHGIKLPYEVYGKLHTYIPDIIVEYKNGRKFLEEIKGYVNDVEIFEAKNKAAEQYCLQNDYIYRILYETDLQIGGE